MDTDILRLGKSFLPWFILRWKTSAFGLNQYSRGNLHVQAQRREHCGFAERREATPLHLKGLQFQTKTNWQLRQTFASEFTCWFTSARSPSVLSCSTKDHFRMRRTLQWIMWKSLASTASSVLTPLTDLRESIDEKERQQQNSFPNNRELVNTFKCIHKGWFRSIGKAPSIAKLIYSLHKPKSETLRERKEGMGACSTSF